jgi:hypothetical protein
MPMPMVKGRGRPPSDFTNAGANLSEDRRRQLGLDAERINSEVIPTPKQLAESARKTRREVLQHYQPEGAPAANQVRELDRVARLQKVAEVLDNSKFARMSAYSAAVHISKGTGLSPRTVRQYIAEIRKLAGPSS